jgi:F-type H+-transporting ATPase subunit delta
MPHSLVAQRYAKAVFELALEMNLVEKVKQDMELIISVCNENKEFMQLLKSPVIRSDKKVKIMESLFKGKVSDISLRFMLIITRKRREEYVRDIASQLLEIYKKFKNIITIYFASATVISDELRQRIVALLENQTKGTIDLREEVRKELIGGFVLSYNDYKYDASIAYQLRKIKKDTAEINLFVRGL